MIFAFSTGEERDKFEFIFHKYKNLMLHKAYEILRDYTLAEDAASEAYIRIYKNIHKIDEPESPRTAAFVVTIVRNAALSMLRREKTLVTEDISEYRSDGFDLEGHVLSELSSEAIYRLMDGLSEELRSVFLLKYAYDMPHREIGEALGITENNVTVRLFRAKKKLAQRLEEAGYVNE